MLAPAAWACIKNLTLKTFLAKHPNIDGIVVAVREFGNVLGQANAGLHEGGQRLWCCSHGDNGGRGRHGRQGRRWYEGGDHRRASNRLDLALVSSIWARPDMS